MARTKSEVVRQARRDVAIVKAILVHGVPVCVLARALGISRQSIHRRLRRARQLRQRLDSGALTPAVAALCLAAPARRRRRQPVSHPVSDERARRAATANEPAFAAHTITERSPA
jgi:hypothetical protein